MNTTCTRVLTGCSDEFSPTSTLHHSQTAICTSWYNVNVAVSKAEASDLHVYRLQSLNFEPWINSKWCLRSKQIIEKKKFLQTIRNYSILGIGQIWEIPTLHSYNVMREGKEKKKRKKRKEKIKRERVLHFSSFYLRGRTSTGYT